MNFASGGDYVMVNTPGVLRAMAKQVQELGVRPELEVFDTGHLVMVKELIADGLIDDPVMIQLCMGIAYGAPDDPATLLSMVNLLPDGAVFSAFSIGRMQIPYVAMAALAGGNVRVGLEDNLYVGPRQLATNAELVDRAKAILDGMNVRVIGPERGPRPSEADQALVSAIAGLRTVGLLGGGVIGGGWAARFLLNGRRRTALRPRRGCSAQDRRGRRQRASRTYPSDVGAPARGRPVDVRGHPGRSGRGSRVRPGERAGAARDQAGPSGGRRRGR